MKKLIMSLLTTNSGISSKAFFLLSITIVGCLLLLACGFVLVFEVIKTGTVHTNITGLSTFVGAVAGLFTAAGLTKAFGDRNERRNQDENK